MRDDATVVTPRDQIGGAGSGHATAPFPPCASCGLRNPAGRRSCLACGAPLGPEEFPSPLPVDPPLFERDAEIAALDQAVNTFLAQKKKSLISILAPSGLGTTRLLRHVVERLLAANTPIRILSTTVRDADGPYPPVTRLLWERFAIAPTKGPATARSEIVAEVSRLLLARAVPPTEHGRRIVIAAGLATDESGRWEANAERDLPRLADSLDRFLSLDAEAQPIVLLVDRLDSASDEGLTLFRTLVGSLTRAPILFVVAGAPQRLEAFRSMASTVVEPRALSPDACENLCHYLLPGLMALPEELLEAVISRSRGAPGRVREILLALIESRVIVADETPWRVELEALGPHGPISTADLLQIRLAQLEPLARSLLSRAAVIGEVFWEGAVLAMTRIEDFPNENPEDERVEQLVHEALRSLAAVELVSPIEESELALQREYVFAAAGLRELLLQTMDPELRKRRHDVCAAWLELAAGPRADDLSRAIAGHLERAGLPEASGRAYLRAARAARASYRGPQAVDLFDRALRLLASGDAPARLDAMHDKGVVLSLLGRVDEARDTFLEMLRLAHRYGARSKVAAALGRLGRLARGRGEMEESRRLLNRALALFQESEDHRGVAAVEDDLGMVAFYSGDYEAAIRHSTRALEMRRELDDPLGEALSTHNLGLVHWARGQPRQARAHLERALALRERHQDVEGTVTTRNVLAILAFERGDIDQAERMWNDIASIAETLGDKRALAYAYANLAEVALHHRDARRATSLIDAAERLANELADRRLGAELERTRSMVARAQNDTARARAHLERCLATARSLRVRELEAMALRGLGEVCSMTVLDFDDAARLSREANEHFTTAEKILEELGASRELARTRAAYGQFLLELGEVMNGRKKLTLAVPVLERNEMAEAGPARRALNAAGGELVIPQK